MKFSKLKLFFFVITFLTLNIYINSFISLDFTYIDKNTGKNEPDTSNMTEYFSSLFNNPIYTTLKVNNKDVKFHLTMSRFSTYISENTLKKIDPEAADEKREKGNLYSLDFIGIPMALFTNSTFGFNLNNQKDLTSYNLSFFMAKKMSNNPKEIEDYCYASEPEEIGLNINRGNKLYKVVVDIDPDEDYREDDDDYYDYSTDETEEDKIHKNDGLYMEESTNIITQLYSKNIIKSYAFEIKYNRNEEKGKIMIGGYPHDYDSNYKESNFIYDSISLEKGLPIWLKQFDFVKYGEENINNIKNIEFSLDSGFIVASTMNKDFFNDRFFTNEKYAAYCGEKTIGNYNVKYCREKVIKEFKKISFSFSTLYNDELNTLEFDYNDLFIKSKNEDYYYFQIVFQSGYYNWLLGRPLFKKYPMVFEQNKKIFGFYKSNNEEENKKISLAWVLVIILIILLICIITVGIVVYIKLISNKRKKKANELIDDNFEYQSKTESTRQSENNQLFQND